MERPVIYPHSHNGIKAQILAPTTFCLKKIVQKTRVKTTSIIPKNALN